VSFHSSVWIFPALEWAQSLTAAYAGGKAIVDENAAHAAVTEVTTD